MKIVTVMVVITLYKTVMAKTKDSLIYFYISDFLILFYRALGNVVSKKLCPQKLPNDIDLVYVDYIGLKQINTKIGTLLPQFM